MCNGGGNGDAFASALCSWAVLANIGHCASCKVKGEAFVHVNYCMSFLFQ